MRSHERARRARYGPPNRRTSREITSGSDKAQRFELC